MPKTQQMPGSPVIDDRRHRFGLILGGLTVAMVALMYLLASYYATKPAGHPISGLVWCVVAYVILRTSIRRQPIPMWGYWIYAALVAIGGVLWLASTLILLPK
jgi:hypothetical protein